MCEPVLMRPVCPFRDGERHEERRGREQHEIGVHVKPDGC
jgi:hypothetical protein